MANMGYCRFQNTLDDLRDCDEHIYDDDLSSDEQRARKQLIELCIKIAAEFTDDDWQLDTESIQED